MFSSTSDSSGRCSSSRIDASRVAFSSSVSENWTPSAPSHVGVISTLGTQSSDRSVTFSPAGTGGGSSSTTPREGQGIPPPSPTSSSSVPTYATFLGIDRGAFEPQFSLRWRPGRRHEIQVGYLFLSRSGEKRLSRDINVRDTTFTAGLNLNTSFGADNAFLAYRYAFSAKENTQIGAQLGLGAIFFEISIDALSGAANGNDTLTTSYGAGASFTGPTAALGLYGRFRLGDRWYLEANAGTIGIKIENITATVFQGGVAGRYFLSKRFGLEAGYGLSTVKIKIDKEGSGGLFDPTAEGLVRYPTQDLRLGVIAAFQ